MENLTFDGVIIGSGPGGTEAARVLSTHGAKIAVIEQALVGGECLHWGCIPSKIYLHSANLFQTMSKMGDTFGVVTDGLRFDFPKLVERRKKVVGMIHRGLENSLKTSGVTIITGKGRLVGPNSVQVIMNDGTEQMLSAKYVILATGSSSRIPDGVKVGGRILTNREVFGLEQQPKSIVITGGGTIGCEMASFFSCIGTRVIMVEMAERLLMREDKEVSSEFLKVITRGDVTVHCKTKVISMEDVGDSAKVVIEREDGTREEIIADYALMAAGRVLNTNVADYDACGIELEKGTGSGTLANARVLTNGFMQTSAANIYAVGDLAGKIMLAYTAEREGEIAAYHILQMKMNGKELLEMDYDDVPSVTFTHPEIASVGFTEEAALAAGKSVSIGKAMFSANSKAFLMGERDGFVKVVVENGTGIVIGVHIIGPDATTMIDKATLAVEMKATVTQMLNAIAGHPVTSETLESALEMVGEK